MRAVEVIQLLGSGACVGATLVMIVLFIVNLEPRRGGSISDDQA
jgi:hypothetical protein